MQISYTKAHFPTILHYRNLINISFNDNWWTTPSSQKKNWKVENHQTKRPRQLSTYNTRMNCFKFREQMKWNVNCTTPLFISETYIHSLACLYNMDNGIYFVTSDCIYWSFNMIQNPKLQFWYRRENLKAELKSNYYRKPAIHDGVPNTIESLMQ